MSIIILSDVEEAFFDISVVIIAAAVMSWLSLMLKQPILLAYMVCGILAGPWVFGLVDELEVLDGISRIGVTLLLFLAGAVLHPNRLVRLFRETVVVTLVSAAASFLLVFPVVRIYGFSPVESAILAAALMFSSTILTIKLLPTTELHQRRMGSLCIAILIVEDLIAVAILMWLSGTRQGDLTAWDFFLLPLKGIFLVAVALVMEEFVIRKMMKQTDFFHETLFLIAMAWCLGMSLLSHYLNFSHEAGAFIAGVALARSPISHFITTGLRPFRDFFLVLFFFILGARLDLDLARQMLYPAIFLSVIIVAVKPLIRYGMFRWSGEEKAFAKETAFRLGQASEFSLIISYLALEMGKIKESAAIMVQLTAIFTMLLNSYWVIAKYPTPLGTLPGMKKD